MSTLKDAIAAATSANVYQPEQRTPALQYDGQNKLLATNPGPDVKDTDYNEATGAAIRFAKAIPAGIASADAELTATAKTLYGNAIDSKETVTEAEAERNSTQDHISNFREADEAGVVNQITYGISKYLIGPALGGAAAKGLGTAASLGTTGAMTGAISYQETKSDLMREGVSREDANKAGLIQGGIMGASIGIPVAGIGKITSVKQGMAYVAASTATATGVMSGGSALTGEYLGNRYIDIKNETPDALKRIEAYKQASERFTNMATDPTSLTLGGVLGFAVGAFVAKGKLSAYRADLALINSLKGDPNIITPSMLDDIELGRLDSPEIMGLRQKYGEDILETLESSKGKRTILTEEEIAAGKTQEEVDLELRRGIGLSIRTTVALRTTKADIDLTVLTDSDRNLIASNERILLEFNRTGDESVLEGLEIPQVHRDAYLLNHNSIAKENYFDLPLQRANAEQGIPYVSPVMHKLTQDGSSTANITTRGETPATKPVRVNNNGTQPYLHQMLGKAEGGGKYDAFNNGKAGDSPGKSLPAGATLGEIMDGQVKGPGRLYFAVGKYQIIPDTLLEAVRILKLDRNAKFTPELQEYIFRNYLLKGKRSQIHAYITGASDNLEAAQLAMAQEFASVGIPRASGGRAKDSSNYSDNKASISSKNMGLALEAQRARYKALIAKGAKAEEAWEQAFYTGAETPLSAVVQADIKAVRSVDQEDGVIYEDRLRDRVVDVPAVPSTPLLTKLIETYNRLTGNSLANNTTYNRAYNKALNSDEKAVIAGEEARAVAWYEGRSDAYAESAYEAAYNATVKGGYSKAAAESRAIQKVYEEKSYQYAIETRNKARDEFNITDKQELDNILQNAFNKHQQSLKIGKSKIFNEELTNIKTLYPDDAPGDQIAMALSNTNSRIKQAAAVRLAPAADTGLQEDAKAKVDDASVNRNVSRSDGTASKVISEETKWYTDKDGKRIPYKVNQDNTGTTTKPNTKDANSVESVVKLEDGTTLTRISTRLPNGRIVNRFIDSQGNISNYASTSSSPTIAQLTNIINSRLNANDTVMINGKSLSRDEVIQQLNNTRKIDTQAIEAFALCSFR